MDAIGRMYILSSSRLRSICSRSRAPGSSRLSSSSGPTFSISSFNPASRALEYDKIAFVLTAYGSAVAAVASGNNTASAFLGYQCNRINNVVQKFLVCIAREWIEAYSANIPWIVLIRQILATRFFAASACHSIMTARLLPRIFSFNAGNKFLLSTKLSRKSYHSSVGQRAWESISSGSSMPSSAV